LINYDNEKDNHDDKGIEEKLKGMLKVMAVPRKNIIPLFNASPGKTRSCQIMKKLLNTNSAFNDLKRLITKDDANNRNIIDADIINFINDTQNTPDTTPTL
jgi:hypothetical protein